MRRRWTDVRWRRWLLPAGMLGILAAAGAAYGQIPAPDGTISTCYTKSTGSIRIIDSGATCKSGETSLSWNQRGPVGPTGASGPQGPKGDTGAAGATGPAGPVGPQGPKGDTGPAGATGPAGPAGLKGDTGPAGASGSQGPKGDTGPAGPKGDTGPAGASGAPGAPGASLTAKPLDPSDPRCGGNGGLDVSTETGAEVGVVCNGTPGAPGAKGDTGPPGSNGGLVGSPCTIPGGTAGTVQMNVAADGTISFACQPSGGGNCSAPNATATCDVNGNVVSLACNDGYADADGILANGCEANLMTDAKNCGSVGNAIPADGLNNATYACVAGKAVITSCSSGFADANNLVADGCEVNLLTDPKNCGSVGTAVPPDGTANANYACVSGKVVITSCLSGFADANHIVGDGCEVNLMVDPANCGSVGNAIPPDGTQHAHYACIGGQVKITGCVSGWFDADGSPVDGCEWQVDQFEPNDTQGSATNFGAFPIGAGFTASPNLTPGNEDWFKFTSTGCLPLFNPCSTKITVTGQTGPVGVTIVRDDGLIVGNGAADSSGANASQTYFVRVFNTTAPFVHYQVNYTNN